MFYNENNFLKKLYFCLIKCRPPPCRALPCPARSFPARAHPPPPPLVLHRALPSPTPQHTPQGTGANGITPER